MAPTKQIQFGTIEIREFPIILSNNPSCNCGPSIEIGWEYNATNPHQAIDVCEYEMLRIGKRRKDKAGRPSKLYLSQVRREAMLKDAGYSDKEVQDAVKEKQKARRQRSLSTYDSVPFIIHANFKASRAEKKVGRAVRNMNRMQKKQNDRTEMFYEKSTLYNGWWLPFSAHYF